MSEKVTPEALRADSIRFTRLLSKGLRTFRWSATGSSIASGGMSASSSGSAEDIWSRLTPIVGAKAIHSSTARSGSFRRLSRGVSSWSAAVRTLSCIYSGLKSMLIASPLYKPSPARMEHKDPRRRRSPRRNHFPVPPTPEKVCDGALGVLVSLCSVLNLHMALRVRRLDDRVADGGALVSVLERRAQRRHALVVHDAVQQVVDLVHHRVLPADDVAVRPPVGHEGMVALGDGDAAEAVGLLFVADPVDLELVDGLEVEADRALLGVDLEAAEVLAAAGEAGRLHRADRAVLELDGRDEGVVDVDLAHALAVEPRALLDEGLGHGADGLDLADEEAGEVDQVCAEVAEGARAGDLLLEAPDVGRVVVRHHPLLQVDRAEVVDAAELSGLDEVVGEPDGRDEAVVERGLVLDLGFPGGVPHGLGFFRGAREGFLAEDVLAGLDGGDGRLGVGVVGAAVVDELDVLVAEHVLPLEVMLLVAVALLRLGDGLFVAAADGDQLGDGDRGIHHVGELLVRVGVGLAHERVAQHADADAGRRLEALDLALGGEAAAFAHPLSSNSPGKGEYIQQD